jgi:hypothetical protein
MSDIEEGRRVKASHDVTQFYQRRPSIRTMSRQELPWDDMNIEDQPSAAREDETSEDDTYMPSPRVHSHGKGLASASGSGVVRDEEIEEEDDGNDGAKGDNDEEDEEIFYVEEINPTSYTHMGTQTFWLPLNPDWREKINYKGKTD